MTSTTRKILPAAVLLLTLGAAAAEAQPASKYKSNGAFAEVYGRDSAGCRSLYLYVARGGTTAAPETFLYYDTYDACANAWGYGSGTISNGSFVTSKNAMTVKVNVRPSPSFYVEGEAPVISLTLTKDGAFTQRSSGHVRIEYSDHSVQRHGTWTYYTAAMSGTFEGSTVVADWAITGTGRDHYMEFDRGTR